MVRNPAGIIVERESAEVWARYAGDCKRLRWVYLAKGSNLTFPMPRKTTTTMQLER